MRVRLQRVQNRITIHQYYSCLLYTSISNLANLTAAAAAATDKRYSDQTVPAAKMMYNDKDVYKRQEEIHLGLALCADARGVLVAVVDVVRQRSGVVEKLREHRP